MIGIRARARARTACGHCWHVVDTGWRCCAGCRGRVKASSAPPEPGVAACRDAGVPPEEDAITAWLAAPLPDRPGSRARRYPYRRLRAL